MISSPYSSHPTGTFINSFWSLLTWDASNLAILSSNLANLELIYPVWSISVHVFLPSYMQNILMLRTVWRLLVLLCYIIGFFKQLSYIMSRVRRNLILTPCCQSP